MSDRGILKLEAGDLPIAIDVWNPASAYRVQVFGSKQFDVPAGEYLVSFRLPGGGWSEQRCNVNAEQETRLTLPGASGLPGGEWSEQRRTVNAEQATKLSLPGTSEAAQDEGRRVAYSDALLRDSFNTLEGLDFLRVDAWDTLTNLPDGDLTVRDALIAPWRLTLRLEGAAPRVILARFRFQAQFRKKNFFVSLPLCPGRPGGCDLRMEMVHDRLVARPQLPNAALTRGFEALRMGELEFVERIIDQQLNRGTLSDDPIAIVAALHCMLGLGVPKRLEDVFKLLAKLPTSVSRSLSDIAILNAERYALRGDRQRGATYLQAAESAGPPVFTASFSLWVRRLTESIDLAGADHHTITRLLSLLRNWASAVDFGEPSLRISSVFLERSPTGYRALSSLGEPKSPAQSPPLERPEPGPTPASGRLSRRVLIGVVTSDKMNKTRRVEVARLEQHGRYGKLIRRRTVCYAHDEENRSCHGDVVEIMETRPLSRLKRWRIVRILDGLTD